ncbi:kumamolisin [Antricoccus suffuscus]|uniref:Kumamolisin n=1 Tax=Antricoccus suffuscus TaxID=1629062 RepID=A0A2T1A1J4_9ACTN|nr:S53 family peptidase [Antricoccus suffuscus]PRZ42463.1 kumamolisin [Antricoccus suffuscus]
MNGKSVVLPGSSRRPVSHVVGARALPADERIAITLILRRRASVPVTATGPVRITSSEFAESYGADPGDVQIVADVLHAAEIDVLETHLASRRMRVAGTAAALGALFGSSMEQVESLDPVTDQSVTHRHRTGELTVPAALSAIVVAVLGLDDRPQSRAHLRAAVEPKVSYTPPELAAAYQFPAEAASSEQHLAILELGGGFTAADLTSYFAGIGVPEPVVTAYGVDGSANAPGKDPTGADGEVMLDIEIAGALTPGTMIDVYFAPNTDAGFVDGVSTAIHASPTPAALSISWGDSEDVWTAQGRNALNDAFIDAAALGVTVTVAAGDGGSSDRATDAKAHCDFPASSPYALGCGGTRLEYDVARGTVSSETVWNDPPHGATGGGVSDAFSLPAWQSGVGVPARPTTSGAGRGVPDVAADADPETGYAVRVDGKDVVYGGTSAVAPLWAALVCILSRSIGRSLGFLQPTLYAGLVAGAVGAGFRDVIEGNNGAYTAKAGWDACTGLGVPVGTDLLARLRSATN